MKNDSLTDVGSLDIQSANLRKASLYFRAINHKLRQQIIQLLHKSGRTSVTIIYQQLRLEQSVISQHLAILRKAGIVTPIRDGKFVFYEVNYGQIQLLHRVAAQLNKEKNDVTLVQYSL